ncbi:MAG: hypothetical protein ACYCSN_06035 [Acidobacteriaceae bacterium]
MSAQTMSLKELIEQTMVALEQMDADALETLVATAQSMREEAAAQPHATLWETAHEATAANDVLKQLLAATDRNLALLRRLRGAAENRTIPGDPGILEARAYEAGSREAQPREVQPREVGRQREVLGYGEKFHRAIGRGGAWQR